MPDIKIPHSMQQTWNNMFPGKTKTAEVNIYQFNELNRAAKADKLVTDEEQNFLDQLNVKLEPESKAGVQPVSFVDDKINSGLNTSIKELLAKAGLAVPAGVSFTEPEKPNFNGDVRILGKNTDVLVFENNKTGRNPEKSGDLHLKGKLDGKKIDILYWDNSSRGAEYIRNNGRFHLSYTIDGEKKEIKTNTEILSKYAK